MGFLISEPNLVSNLLYRPVYSNPFTIRVKYRGLSVNIWVVMIS